MIFCIQIESNARFVKWSDGSLQLLIGNEVLNLNVQEAQHDHTHLFLRHEKVCFFSTIISIQNCLVFSILYIFCMFPT